MTVPRRRTVLFAMLSEAGHYTGTFRLARELAARGHRVLYLGIADFRELVEDQGFGFVPFAEDLLPLGYLRRFLASHHGRRRGLIRRRRTRRDAERVFVQYLERILGGPLDECLASCQADLLLCDTFVWYVALRASRAAIPTISLCIPLSLRENRSVPPILSAMDPAAGPLGVLRVIAAWKWMRLRFFFTKRLASTLVGAYRHPTRMHHLVHVFKAIARRSGYPCRENETYWFGEMGPRLALPEVVLCPRAFQLPEAPDDGRLHVADGIDTGRHEEALATTPEPARGPLVLCSLGTSASFYPHTLRFFRAVVAASHLRMDWQFVLHTGNWADRTSLGIPAPNLVLAEKVPQLTLLRRASVMVNHGGLNSVLECIRFEVPMVILPGLRDQPGNAVRARRLGVAHVATMASITPQNLIALVETAMHDQTLRAALGRARRQIDAEGGLTDAIRLVEDSFRADRT